MVRKGIYEGQRPTPETRGARPHKTVSEFYPFRTTGVRSRSKPKPSTQNQKQFRRSLVYCLCRRNSDCRLLPP